MVHQEEPYENVGLFFIAITRNVELVHHRRMRTARARRPLRRANRVRWTLFRAREIYFLRTTNVNSDSDVCTKEGETIYSIGSPFFHLKGRNYLTYEDQSDSLSLLILRM